MVPALWQSGGAYTSGVSGLVAAPGWPTLDRRSEPQRATARATLFGVVLLHVVSVAFFTWSSYFFYDDYVFLRQAQRQGLSLAFLLEPLNPHLSPGHRLVNWALQSWFPLNFRVAQVLLLACSAGSVLVLHRVLVELFGARRRVLLLTLLYATSVVHVGIVLWWNGGLLTLPAALLSLLAILGYLRFRRTGSRRALVLSVGALTLALLFYLKAVLVPLYLVLLRSLLLEPTRALRASLVATAQEWRVWLAYLVPVGIYLVVFLAGYWEPSEPPAVGLVGEYLHIAWARVFAPSFFGFWTAKAGASMSDQLAVVGVQIGLAVVVVITVLRHRRAWRAWAFFLVAFLANALLVGIPRLEWGSGIAYAPRYYLEATFLFPIALGAAFSSVGEAAGAASSATAAGRRWGRATWAAVVLVAAAHLTFAWSSASDLRDDSPGPAAGTYMRNVKDGLRRAERAGIRPTLVDGIVPDFVFPRWAAYGRPNRYSEVFRLIDRSLVFDRPASALFDVDRDGTLQPVAFTPHSGGEGRALLDRGELSVTYATTGAAQPDPCVRPTVFPAVVEFSPVVPLVGHEWFLSLHYHASVRRTVPLSVDEGSGYRYADGSVTLLGRGDGAVLVRLGVRRLTRLRLDVPPGSGFCLRRLEVGRLLPR